MTNGPPESNRAAIPAKVLELLHASKDKTVAFALRTFINTKLSGIGDLTELSIDTAERKAFAKLALLGERRAVDVNIEKYRVDWKGDVPGVTVLKATASRTWLDAALGMFVVGRRFRIPSKPAVLVRLLT